MEPRLRVDPRILSILIILLSTGLGEDDWQFCGNWHHGRDPLRLTYDLSPGFEGISISANQSTLSIVGKITSQCLHSKIIFLKESGLESAEKSSFCLYWEPLLDQLKLKIRNKTFALCWPASVKGPDCTDLSHGLNANETRYGIANGTVINDVITHKIQTRYTFKGMPMSCSSLGSAKVSKTEASGKCSHATVDPFPHSYEVDMMGNFRGYNVTSPATEGESAESTVTVQIPTALKQAAKSTSKVVCTFFKNNSLFQEDDTENRILDNVVGITVENEVIANLSEPIKIGFHHSGIPKTHSRKCVSWDTRKDPLQVKWLVDGCVTRQKGANYTECLCNHLTYFSVLVQLEPRPVCYLLALTTISYLGCAVSVFSCVALIIFFWKKRRSKEQSIPIHLGLALSLAFLNLIFFFTGVLANVEGGSLCTWVGAALHYSLLSSLIWMGIEVFHTFWLVYKVLSPSPKPHVWYLLGFVLPAVPVITLSAVGDIYGVREVLPCTDITNPYLMCGMTHTPKAWLAHYFTNITILVILVLSGNVMLFLVYREIRTRDEWRQSRVAFLSIWGLSCLFGATWGLNFLEFGPLTDFIHFLTCTLNSFQGFFLMLRFYMLDWMRKQTGGSTLVSTSTGSTRQQMLKGQTYS